MPIFMAMMIDNGVATGDHGYLLRVGGIMLLIAIVGLASAVYCQYSAAVASTGFATALRSGLFRHIQRLPSERLDQLGADTLTTRVTNDVNQLQNGLAMIIRLLIRAPFVSIGCIAAAMMVDLPLSIVMAVAVPLFALVLVVVMAKSSPLYTRVQQRLDHLSLVLRENLSGVRVVRAFCRTGRERERVGKSVDETAESAVRVARVSTLLNPLTTCIMNFAIIAILWFGGVRVNIGGMTQGQVVAFISYITQVLTALIAVANLVVILTRAYASLGRVKAILEMPEDADPLAVEGGTPLPDGDGQRPETPARPAASSQRPACPPQEGPLAEKGAPKPGGGIPWDDTAPCVEFCDVSFRYSKTGDYALSHVTFTLPRGQTLGVIGGTGSGKSTLVNLIERFYRATQGEVRFCGVNVNQIPAKELRAQIGLVSQGAALFSGSIEDNIRWGKPDASDEELWSAAGTAQAAEFIEQKPSKMKTYLGRGGKGLSGGQRQRLTIARALVRRPRLLILDDAASALDFATDAKLRKALAADDSGRTVITVSQRASTVRYCDRILVLSEGGVVGLGTHEELMATCGEYREIVLSQQDNESA